ncbi:hypothetical protein PQX77_020339 [Marasmius sp. AFHP31]|nr:hypothetical protein PQX77_020339 [Marasmius sp. AFHP31]
MPEDSVYRDWRMVTFAFLALVSNLLLTMLIGENALALNQKATHLEVIAGRIFYVAYQAGKYLPVRTSVPTVYKTIISATLESGLIYPTALMIYAACMLKYKQIAADQRRYDFTSILTADLLFESLVTIMGIASTLIIVRVTLGLAIHDEKSFKETILNDIEPPQAQNHTSHNVIDIRQRVSPNTQESYMESQEDIGPDLEAQKKG